MEDIKLNLGCGARHFEGFINVDKFGDPDLILDLETFPWPWHDNTVSEVVLFHVLEHLGQTTDTYLSIIKELYRVSRHEAQVRIVVPHYRHEYFFDDPTHVRAVTPMGLQLFSQQANNEWIRKGASNSPLGLYLDVDFELKQVIYKPSSDWFRLHPEQPVDVDLLRREGNIHNNLIEEIDMTLKVVKDKSGMH